MLRRIRRPSLLRSNSPRLVWARCARFSFPAQLMAAKQFNSVMPSQANTSSVCRLASSLLDDGSVNCRCVDIIEGKSYRAFVLTMDDGREVLINTNTPRTIAGSNRFVTASEVATLKFGLLPPPSATRYRSFDADMNFSSASVNVPAGSPRPCLEYRLGKRKRVGIYHPGEDSRGRLG
ncbi:hypothetical protein BO86DRAFT_141591 [Aspergillus japonicus CBS 114.51]|uniref:Uncharacterized protein n=1 Tax=Aspergillus japonicus CBS 114.51 TaxID=1448312 RepID=A0A8T8XDC1_ASPJA|nr:hypothetical protein BO86DRAFT_141591 [Aspergillus japonicus CBS 114.51]RAH86293.1 hypothetical protein BO86DRAFT_141591 [Aspergillus japonicus CBS 114.51]